MFTLAVDKATFIRFTSREPEQFDENNFNPGTFDLGPEEIFGVYSGEKIKISVTVMKL